MKQYKRGASWSISQKERKSEKIRLSPINRYFAMVPRKYLAKLSQTRISSSCRSCFLLKKCSSPPQTFNTQKRSKRRGREAVERANDRSSDAESFFLKSRVRSRLPPSPVSPLLLHCLATCSQASII